jgi:hypothetical protein
MSDDNENEQEEETSTVLVPLETRTVDFYGDPITAALVQQNEEQIVYVPIRPLCDYLGLSWSGQRQRINRDPVMSRAQRVCIIHTRSRGATEMICLPLELLPGFLFGVTASKVKPELQDKIIRYQTECFKVLWRAFKEEAKAIPFTTTQQGRTANWQEPSPLFLQLIQMKQQNAAMGNLIDAQIELETKALEALDQAHYAHQRIDEFYLFANGLDQKIGKIEQKVGEIEQIVRPGATISEAQASVIVNTVKALAQYLTTKEPGKNHFQGIFGELYRLFQVGEYRRVRQADYPAVLAFLDEWHKKAGGSGIHTQALMPLDPEPEV